MRKADSVALAGLVATVLLLILTAVLPRLLPSRNAPSDLRCVVDLRPYADSVKGHLNGYNYHLLGRFARESGHEATVKLATRGENWLDSLKAGRADIVAVPRTAVEASTSGEATRGAAELLFSAPIDSFSVWAVRVSEKALLREINAWIDSWHVSPHHAGTHESYMRTYEPRRRAATGRRYP